MGEDKVAAVILARAIADAINPERPTDTALLGNAMFQPLTLKVIGLLREQGWRLQRIETCRPEAA
jgi:hypothetical protein